MRLKHKKKYDATRSEEGGFHEDIKESWIRNEKKVILDISGCQIYQFSLFQLLI